MRKPIVKNILIGLLILICNSMLSGQLPVNKQNIDFNKDWEFQYRDNWYQAKVPGTIHTDLYKNNLIEDPFWENNEQKLLWIEKEDWSYRKTFHATSEILKNKHIELVFEGLDTYADVYLNGTSILSSINMFREWRKDIKPLIRKGENTLEVKFRSPLTENKEKVESYPYKLPAANETVELKVSPFTRKAAYQFGWDWGPRFVGCGIWRPVKLEVWNDAKIIDTHIYSTIIDSSLAIMHIQLDLKIEQDTEETYTISVNDIFHHFLLNKSNHTINIEYPITNPKLWYPNGMGEAYLYNLDINLIKDDKIIDNTCNKIGIRNIKLINKKDKIGTSFFFEVNGEPLFIKGANYIPQDIFLGNVTVDKYRQLLSKVKNSHMNMLRVWGGGIYENDIFYDLCDEYGIMVWQDFMFAGSLYPDTDEFLDNVKEEIDYNIKRLRNHACLALWCGNNEIEVAWENWGWQKQYGYNKNDSLEIWKNYLYLFKDMIPNRVKVLNPTTDYVSTSPLSNWGTPENFKHSSMHYWGVWHGKEPFVNFKTNVGRFMVEYGFQSFPRMELIRTFAVDSSLYLHSAVMQNRQKSYIGNGLLKEHINRWYGDSESFEDFVNKNQLVQSEALKLAIKSHRKSKPHCMGTLFWQLNDCWPGPSWSVIDYSGYDKPAMATVAEYFKPVIAVVEEDNDTLSVFIVSDMCIAQQGKLRLRLKSTDNKTLYEENLPYHLEKDTVKMIFQKPLQQLIRNHNKEEIYVEVKLTQDDEVIFKDELRFAPPNKT